MKSDLVRYHIKNSSGKRISIVDAKSVLIIAANSYLSSV